MTRLRDLLRAFADHVVPTLQAGADVMKTHRRAYDRRNRYFGNPRAADLPGDLRYVA